MNKIAAEEEILAPFDSSYLHWTREQMTENRWSHTLGVIKNIDRLLENFPELKPHSDQLRLAALFHDVAKDLPRHRQRRLADKYRCGLDKIELQLPPIWHGPAAAQLIMSKFEFNQEELLLSAISLHSTGSSTKQIVCDALIVADFAAFDRKFPEAKEIRDLIPRLSLNRLTLETIRYKLLECLDSYKTLHPRSLEAYNRLCD